MSNSSEVCSADLQAVLPQQQYGLLPAACAQMGTDLQRLSWGLQQLQELCSELPGATDSSSSGSGNSRRSSTQLPQLFGSLFIPSKRLLAQMRFRWAAAAGCLFDIITVSSCEAGGRRVASMMQ